MYYAMYKMYYMIYIMYFTVFPLSTHADYVSVVHIHSRFQSKRSMAYCPSSVLISSHYSWLHTQL